MDSVPDDRAEGERRRDVALKHLRSHRAPFVRRFQRAYVLHLIQHGPDTSDPARAVVPCPPGMDPRVIGCAVRALASEHGVTVPTGAQQKSRRAAAHARKLDIWAIRDRDAAERWLLLNPELPDDPTPPPLDYCI